MRKILQKETEQHLKNLRIYGYTQVHQFIDPKTVKRAKDLVEKYYKETKRSLKIKGGRADPKIDGKGVFNLQNKDKFFIDILDHPFLRTVLMAKLNDPYYRFLPPDVPNYILGYYNARSSGSKLDLHIDSYFPAPGEISWAVQMGIPLEDHTLENGCTVIVPGSHLIGSYTDRNFENAKPLLSKAGDLLLWDSRTWHGTINNISGKSRWTLLSTFTMWWIKQIMDITRGLPDEIYKTLSDRQKQLLGFCAIPPKNEFERINTKAGYDALLPSVKDYYK